MRINLLGPLEITHHGQSVPLRGIKQRAALGFLALHANQVVATSRLLDALWGADSPATARKVLHNAVSRVRTALAVDKSVTLLTRRPGYVLRIDPEDVDLCRFTNLAEQGRGELMAGSWQAAATSLGKALALWRGPALADLIEVHGDWPELDRLCALRTTVFEDHMEAELASGRHHEVLEELATATRTHGPSRERLCRQYMLALYRAGRQADALAFYRQTRATLVNELGLDPGTELVDLERAILAHDPKLRPPEPAHDLTARPVPVTAPPTSTEFTERKRVTVLAIAAPSDDPDDLIDTLAAVESAAVPEVERFGGRVLPAVGSVWLALFGAPLTGPDDPEHAVRAALAIGCRLPDAGVRIAVATGVAVVHTTAPGASRVVGGPVGTCLRLVEQVPPGAIRVCERTRAASRHRIGYADAANPPGTAEVRQPRGTHVAVPFVGREAYLERLLGVFAEVRLRRRARLVTVVGEPGVGKSRLGEEVARAAGDVRVVRPWPGVLAPTAELDAATAAGEPTIVLLEDLHEADGAVLDAVDELLVRAAATPLLVVVSGRPELRDRRPGWPVTITLPPLTGQSAGRLIKAVLDEYGVPVTPELTRSLRADVAGVPMFAVEYARSLRDEPRDAVPEPVHGVIAARLDTLATARKRLLQDAAVLGGTVSVEVLAAVGDTEPSEVRGGLEQLVRHGLVARSGSGYVVVSAAVRDVARSQVPRAVREHRRTKAAALRLP